MIRKFIFGILALASLYIAPALAQSPPFNGGSIGTLGGQCPKWGAVIYQSQNGVTKCLDPTGNSGKLFTSQGLGVDPQWTAPGALSTNIQAGITPTTFFSANQFVYSNGTNVLAGTFGTGLSFTGTTLNAAVTNPGGASTTVQYNNAGVFGGMSGTVWDDANRSLAISGGTPAASTPILNLSQGWTGTGTFTAMRLNVPTDTGPANAGSLLFDVQKNSTSLVNIRADGLIQGNGIGMLLGSHFASSTAAGVNGVNLGSTNAYGITSGGPFAVADTILSRKAAANWQFGNADAAAPVAQTIGPQSVVTGTANTAGAAFTINDSGSTGSAASGGFLFRTTPLGGAGSTSNTRVTALTIAGSGAATFVSGVTATALTSSGSVASGAQYIFTGSSRIQAPVNGNLEISNSAVSDFGLLQLGGTTSSFPAIKRNTTAIDIRLADDSGFAPLNSGAQSVTGNQTTSGTNTTTGNISTGAKYLATGSAPALSTCGGGTPTITGNDHVGNIVTGTITTVCTLTFNVAYPTNAWCQITPVGSGTGFASYIVTNASTGFTMNAGGTVSAASYNYMCSGN